jgi:hypothetical protein
MRAGMRSPLAANGIPGSLIRCYVPDVTSGTLAVS